MTTIKLLIAGIAVSLAFLSLAHFWHVEASRSSRVANSENISLLIELAALQTKRIDMLEQTK